MGSLNGSENLQVAKAASSITFKEFGKLHTTGPYSKQYDGIVSVPSNRRICLIEAKPKSVFLLHATPKVSISTASIAYPVPLPVIGV